jgi:hypothetical protein
MAKGLSYGRFGALKGKTQSTGLVAVSIPGIFSADRRII